MKEANMKQPKTDSLPVSDEIAKSNEVWVHQPSLTMDEQLQKIDALRERVNRSKDSDSDRFSVGILHLPANEDSETDTLFALYCDSKLLCGPFANIELLHRYIDIRERLDEFVSLTEDTEGGLVLEELYSFTIINDRYRVSVVDTWEDQS
jgi:hypothetical protein